MSEQGGVDALVVEVTVNIYAQRADGRVVGGNVADATIGFAIRTDPAPEHVPDERVNATLGVAISPVLAGITEILVHNGWTSIGQVAEPISEKATPTGEVGRTHPVTVVHPAPGETGRPS